MSDIVERLSNFKENVSNDMIELLETPEICVEAANEIKRMRAENEWFKKAQGVRDAEDQLAMDALRAELAAAKALLREVLLYLGHTHYPVSMPERIRAALGENQ